MESWLEDEVFKWISERFGEQVAQKFEGEDCSVTFWAAKS